MPSESVRWAPRTWFLHRSHSTLLGLAGGINAGFTHGETKAQWIEHPGPKPFLTSVQIGWCAIATANPISSFTAL